MASAPGFAIKIESLEGSVWSPALMLITDVILGGKRLAIRESWNATKEGLRVTREAQDEGSEEWVLVFDYVLTAPVHRG